MDKLFVNFLPPWVETNIQPAFYDKESGSVLQQTARMYAKVNCLVRMFNKLSKETKETVDEYIAKFVELKDFVDTYFENLDVQEEINNKLDEMTESGQLADLIARYIGLGALITFNTLSDMVSSDNLSKGAKCKTLGKDSLNDGFGAYYTIDETGDIALENGLYATLVPDFGGNNYYDEITFVKERHYNTDCYFTTIPMLDSESEEIPLYIGQASSTSETPEKYAQNHYTTFTANATLNYGGAIGVGSLIKDGEIVRNIDTSSLQSGYRYIAIKDNREIIDFQANSTTADAMLAAGCKMAWLVYFRLVQAGEAVNFDNIVVGGDNIVAGRHPRQCLGQKLNGDIIIMTCGGRTVNDQGLTAEECATLMIAKGCSKAWNLDGGGSASTMIKGTKINRDIDSSRTVDRYIEWTLNVKKETIDKELAKTYSHIGAVKNNLSDDLMPLINFCLKHTQIIDISGQSLDDLTDELIFAMGNGLTNSPVNAAGYFINLPHFNPEYIGLYTKQIFFIRDQNQIFTRTLVNGTFSPWYNIKGDIADFSTLVPQTIQTTDVYLPLTFNTSMLDGNSDIFNLYQPDSDGNSTRITVNSYGKVNFRTYVIIDPIATRDVFLRYILGSNNPFERTRTKIHVKAGERICVPVEFDYRNCIPGNTFGIEYYGQSGDKLDFKTIVEL